MAAFMLVFASQSSSPISILRSHILCLSRPLECGVGEHQSPSTGRCQVCPDDTYKANKGPGPCQPCARGTVTTGCSAIDHDSPADCTPGALCVGVNRLSKFKLQSERLDNTVSVYKRLVFSLLYVYLRTIPNDDKRSSTTMHVFHTC
jgi:hypothetical protein